MTSPRPSQSQRPEPSLRRKHAGLPVLLGAALLCAACPPAPVVKPPPPVTTPPPTIQPPLVVAPPPRPLPKGPAYAMRPAAPASVPVLDDDLPLPPLLAAIEDEIRVLEKRSPGAELIFGPHTVSVSDHVRSLRRFVELGRTAKDKLAFLKAVRNEFTFYEVYGQKDWSEAFITSYYAPVIKGSRRPTERLSQPIYRRPTDLVTIDLTDFDKRLSMVRKLRGRVVNQRLVPYYTRDEIDERYVLRGRNLEICWVDPLDAFTFHTEGSGDVKFDDGTSLRLVYDDKNGHIYEKIVKFLNLQLPKEKINYFVIEQALRAMPVAEMRKILAKNPSYVFFKPSDATADTSLGVNATDGRTIATDARFFPKSAIVFIASEKPRFADAQPGHPVGWEPMRRFVLDQDTGGAIVGGGRIDLFWGHGPDAKRYADVIKQQGKMYYLLLKTVVPKPSRTLETTTGPTTEE